jgi:hypothetical protein
VNKFFDNSIIQQVMTGTSLFFYHQPKGKNKRKKRAKTKMKEKKLDDLETCTFCWYLEDWSKLKLFENILYDEE